MLLASDALSKFDGSTAPPTSPAQQPSPPAQQSSAEAHPPPAPPPAAQAPETASSVVPPQPAAAPVTPVAEPRAKETPPQNGSTQGEEEETEGPQAVATATANLNSAKAEAKLVKALDYLVAINDNSDNPGQKWVINESILASLTGCFRPAIKKFVETAPLSIRLTIPTDSDRAPWQGKGRSGRYPSPG
jgi:outer membrane biosynthesis protein TonB